MPSPGLPAQGLPVTATEAEADQSVLGTSANVAEGAFAQVCSTGPELIPTETHAEII